jgi:isopentenyl-diphosphate delta-isomerase
MRIPIVNEKDEIIGYKDRADIDYTNDIFRSASLWVTNSNGEVLLARRSLGKRNDPGKWSEAVGGTVEGNDLYKDTVIREAKEELGIENFEMTIGPKQMLDGSCRCFAQWYVAKIDLPVEAFTIQNEEVDEVVWVPLEQLKLDLNANPDKYIESMPDILGLFS